MSIFDRLFRKDGGIETYIIAGLGNPGPEYEMTKHNCGYRAADIVADKLGISFTKRKFNSLYCDCKIRKGGDEVRVILMKPETYMNNSGDAIEAAAAFYKVPAENIIVIYDDCDVEPGRIRVRGFGSAGTHNGMESVVSCLGTEKFPRIRVGIGRRMPNEDMVKFVLSGFSPDKEKLVKEALGFAANASLAIIKKGIEKAMTEFNSKQAKPEAAADAKEKTTQDKD